MTEREIFFAALDRDDSTERSAYLDQVCATDTALRQRVEALLRSHANVGEFLDVPAVEQVVGEGDGALHFLAPSEEPGSLGRLGHYEILEVVGQGGMGIVFRARDTKLQRVIAIKALAPQLATSASARERFVREARTTATVTHDNVIAIHAVEGTSPVPFLVMPFIDGPTLQQKLDRTGPLPLKDVLRIGRQIAEGLAAAHKQGLIHRDVKPANILLENGVERVKITDFGLARAADDATLTRSGVVAGTPMYMSPEQAEGASVDFRSDLFSLGSVLYAMCTGVPPFRASTAVAVLRRVSDEVPRPVRDINPEIPEYLCSAIARLQAKNPADRFQTAAEVAELFGQHQTRQHEPLPGGAPGSRTPKRERTRRSRAAFVAGLLVLMSVLLVAGVAGVLRYRDRAVEFEGIDSPANHAFVARFRAKYGPQRALSDPLEASYVGVHLWAQAVRAAGTTDPVAVRRALSGQRFHAPSGEVRIDPETQHLWKTPRVARITDKGTAEIVWSALEPVRPVPFPASRSREQWQQFLANLHQGWGGQWSAPAPTWERTVAGMPADKQIEAVARRLRDLNPNFDGKIPRHKIEHDVITEIEIGPRVDDISPLRALVGLKSFSCNQGLEPALADLSALRDLKLTSLSLNFSRVWDLTPLKGMKLTSLHIASAPVTDLSPLKGMKLTSLHIVSAPLTDLSPLKDMPLISLSLDNTKVVDLSPLKGNKTLTTLDLWMAPVLDLSPLKDVPLTSLNIGRTGVTDLSDVKDMPLTILKFRDAHVRDLSPLKGHKTLTRLDCHHSPVSDLSPLKGLKLTELNCFNAKVTDLTPLTGMPLVKLTIDFRAERDTEVLRSLKDLKVINGKPTEEFWKEHGLQPEA